MAQSLSSIHHTFDIELAAQYGVHEAILIHHFQHWIHYNKALKRNFKEDRTWTYQTLEEIAAHFPYMPKEKVRDIVERLCLGKSRYSQAESEFEPVLIKGNFNKSAFDKTTWYAFKNEKMFTKGEFPKSMTSQIISTKGEFPTSTGVSPTSIIGTHTKPDTRTKQQQTPKKIAAVFFDSLKGIDIPDSEKRWLMEHHNEEEINHAVAYLFQPDVNVKTTIEQTLKWACQKQPKLTQPKENVIKKNKDIAKFYENEFKHECFRLDVLTKHLEITPLGGMQLPIALSYDDPKFEESLKKTIKEKEFKTKKRNLYD